MKTLVFLFSILSFTVLSSGADTSVTKTRKYTSEGLEMTVVAGEVDLPSGGYWLSEEPGTDSGISQVQLVLSESAMEAVHGNRQRKAEVAKEIQAEQYPIWSIYSVCTAYAKTNNGIGPEKWADITTNKVRNLPREFASLKTSFFLIPSVPINYGGRNEERLTLALQLHPVAADGKHWVLYNNGQSLRVAIDKALCDKYGVVVVPKAKPEAEEEVKPAVKTLRYGVTALLKKAGSHQLTISNRTTGKTMKLAWDTGKAEAGDAEVLTRWAQMRAMRWLMLAANGDAPVLRYWLARSKTLYGADMPDLEERDGRNRGESVDAFSVLGGRAAVRETLQMQSLQKSGTAKAKEDVPIQDIKGVEVKSHPFAEMLKNVKPGELPLAENVPEDRAFLYFPKPDTLLPLMDGGADFVFQGGSLAMANPAAYDLKNRYVDRLALTDKWVRDLLLKSGAIKEMAVFFPDLFFIDGTEVTVVARAPAAALLKPALKLIGVDGLSDSIKEKDGKAGKSFWAMDGDLLVISTSRSEAEKVLAMRKAKGKGSLGQTEEFKYMLAQMPLRPETRFLCYFSDPFIRRLVGPGVKIGQLRRLIAKGEMENVSSAALLYKLDGHAAKPDIKTLVEKGYLAAEPSVAAGCTIDERLAASCPAYGSTARMKTLLENPVVTATAEEAESYKAYVDNYSRFWRQYFDPIAFRLDDGAKGELQLTTFILPLIDNTIYNGLKEVMCHKENGTPLRLPDLNPKPLLMLSANLSEDSWTKVTSEMFLDLLRHYTTLDPAAFDKIGPSVHLAIYDADPIVTFGAGDALGIFGAPMMGGGRNAEMLFVPVIASIVTRPCQLIVELKDPDAVRRMMLTAGTSPLGRERRWEPIASFYKVDGRDAWVCTISIENIVKIRFGVEVRDKYLILSNLPWSQKPVFGQTKNADLNTLALDLHPEAGALQMPGLFTVACEQERSAAVQGERYLYPMLACGAGSVSNAVEQCRTMFGFVPEHPGKGQWTWENGRIRSTVYGEAGYPVQPEYKPGDRAFGVLGGLETLNLNLQFEDAGLRVITRWKLKE